MIPWQPYCSSIESQGYTKEREVQQQLRLHLQLLRQPHPGAYLLCLLCPDGSICAGQCGGDRIDEAPGGVPQDGAGR